MLQALRVQKGLTQKQLADKLGISESMVQKVELGKRGVGLKTAIKFSKFYRKSLTQLFFAQDTHGCVKNEPETNMEA